MAFNKKLVRNVTVPITESRKTLYSPAGTSDCAVNGIESVIQVNSTLQLLQEIKNLKERDLDIDSDNDILCRAANFNSSEHLYTDLVKLKISSKCQVKRSEIPKQPTRKDILPSSKEFLSYSLEPEFKYNSIVTTMTPEGLKRASMHDFYIKKKSWKT